MPNTWTKDALLARRAKALELNAGFLVSQAETLLDRDFPGWRDELQASQLLTFSRLEAFVLEGGRLVYRG